MVIGVLTAALLTLPLQAIALDAGEFHLYGVSKSGIAFDVTPYGDDTAGDPESRQGFRSQFVRWVKAGEVSEMKPHRVCTATDATAMYAFGAAWAGQIAVVGTGQGTSDASLISAGAHEIAAELKRVGRVGGPQ